MRIFHAPLVILIARPSLDTNGIDQLLAEYGYPWTVGDGHFNGWRRDRDDVDVDALPELMGRLCYGSFGERQGRIGAAAYHSNILGSGHGSVLEHACLSFVVCRASRGFTHQMVRHRAGVSPSQESQHFIRYTTDDDDEKSVQEAGVCLTGIPEELHDHYLGSVRRAVLDYAVAWREMKGRGLKKKDACERARGLLPNILESRIGLTMNARAIRHFCELRGTPDNILEIRLVACQIAEIMLREAPAIFQDFTIGDGGDGYPIVTSTHRKV